MARTVERAPTTTTTLTTTPYVIKLPMARAGTKTKTTNTSQSSRFELPPITFEPRKPHMITCETTKTVTERVKRLIDEPCSMQACKKENGRHARTLVVIVMAAFDEYKGKTFDNEHPMCPGCADKIKRSFMGEKVVR